METPAKDQRVPGKKEGTSSSSSSSSYQRRTATQSRRSPSALSPSCPPAKKYALSTTQSEKRIPNYLKPTVSSAPNPSIQGRTQPQSNNVVQKPTLNRRRSFDKPPSPNSRFQRSHTLVSLQSSSNAAPIRNSSLPISPKERLLKPHRDTEKSHSVYSSNKKRTSIKKQDVDATTCAAPAGALIIDPNSSLPDLTADANPVVECHQEDHESSVADDVEEEREMKVDENNNDFPSEISVREAGKKKVIKADTGGDSQVRAAELEKHQNQETKAYESSSVVDNLNDSLDLHVEESDEKEEIDEETRKDEIKESHQEEIVNGDDKEGEESELEISKDKKQEVGEGTKMEREGVEDIETETKTEMDNIEGKQQRQGKKEPQAFNDVIEETACKLLEKRKNKVKALVGAFETVISLQEPEA